MQSPAPVQTPLQPANVEPPMGTAVRTTGSSTMNMPEQLVAVQVMPAGTEVTVKPPAMVEVGSPLVTPTESLARCAKLTHTVRLALAITVHGFVPLQPPPNPRKPDVVSAVGRMSTAVPAGTSMVQVFGQSMPTGRERTWPVPVPTGATLISTIGGGVTVGGGATVDCCGGLLPPHPSVQTTDANTDTKTERIRPPGR